MPRKRRSQLWIGELDSSLELARQVFELFNATFSVRVPDDIEIDFPGFRFDEIYYGSSIRGEQLDVIQAELESLLGVSKIKMVLGTDYASTRRTSPVANTVDCFHWYEVFQQIASSISRETIETEESESHSEQVRGDGIALVVSEANSRRSLWQSTLDSMGVTNIACGFDDQLPIGNVESILVDMAEFKQRSFSQQSGFGAQIELHERLYRSYREAQQIIVDGFPNVSDWKHWLGEEVVCLPSPFDFQALEFWLNNSMPKKQATRRIRSVRA